MTHRKPLTGTLQHSWSETGWLLLFCTGFLLLIAKPAIFPLFFSRSGTSKASRLIGDVFASLPQIHQNSRVNGCWPYLPSVKGLLSVYRNQKPLEIKKRNSPHFKYQRQAVNVLLSQSSILGFFLLSVESLNKKWTNVINRMRRMRSALIILKMYCCQDVLQIYRLHLNAYQPACTLSEILINVSMSCGFAKSHKLLLCFVSTVRGIPRVLILTLTATGTSNFKYHSASHVFFSPFFFFFFTPNPSGAASTPDRVVRRRVSSNWRSRTRCVMLSCVLCCVGVGVDHRETWLAAALAVRVNRKRCVFRCSAGFKGVIWRN